MYVCVYVCIHVCMCVHMTVNRDSEATGIMQPHIATHNHTHTPSSTQNNTTQYRCRMTPCEIAQWWLWTRVWGVGNVIWTQCLDRVLAIVWDTYIFSCVVVCNCVWLCGGLSLLLHSFCLLSSKHPPTNTPTCMHILLHPHPIQLITTHPDHHHNPHPHPHPHPHPTTVPEGRLFEGLAFTLAPIRGTPEEEPARQLIKRAGGRLFDQATMQVAMHSRPIAVCPPSLTKRQMQQLSEGGATRDFRHGIMCGARGWDVRVGHGGVCLMCVCLCVCLCLSAVVVVTGVVT